MLQPKIFFNQINGAQVNALDYGLVAGGAAVANTTAIRAAMTAVYDAYGGGTVYIPAGTYLIKDLQFVDVNAVVICGDSEAFNYGNYTGGGTILKVDATATYGIWSRYVAAVMPNGSLNGIRNLFITPNGAAGSVEYGYVCSVSSAFASNISCINFQFNYTGWALNSNVNEHCSWGYATLCGYSVLSNIIAELEYQAPSLWALMTATEKTDSSASTLFVESHSNMRGSLFGVALRGGNGGVFDACVIEGNAHQGLIIFDSARNNFRGCHIEANYSSVAAVGDVTGVYSLKSSASTYLVGSTIGAYGAGDLGFDIIIGETAESTSLVNTAHETQFNIFDQCFLANGTYTTGGIRVRSGMGNTFQDLYYADDGDNLVTQQISAVNNVWNNTKFKFDGTSSGGNFEFYNLPMATGTNTSVVDGQKIPFWRGANVTFTANNPPTNWNSIGIGRGVLQAAASGANNTVIGEGAASLMVASGGCTLVGKDTGAALVSGSNHTCIGYTAGNGITTGANNLLLGYQAGTASSPSGALTTASNQIVLGNSSISNAHIQVAWTVVSDSRDKIIEGSVPYGLDFVNMLHPIIGKMNNRSRYIDSPDAIAGSLVDADSRLMLVAQDVLAAEKAHGTAGVIVNTSDPERLTLTETAMIPVLIHAIQELSIAFDEYKASHP